MMRHDRGLVQVKHVFWSCLCVMGLIVSACVSKEKVYTASSSQTLPPIGSRISIWSQDSIAAETTHRWLSDRGLQALPSPNASSKEKDVSTLCTEVCDVRAIVQAVGNKDADYIIVVRVLKGPLPMRQAVRIHGISLALSTEVLNGSGWDLSEAKTSDDRAEGLRILVCKTLATVWRFRPAGLIENESIDYCQVPRLRA